MFTMHAPVNEGTLWDVLYYLGKRHADLRVLRGRRLAWTGNSITVAALAGWMLALFAGPPVIHDHFWATTIVAGVAFATGVVLFGIGDAVRRRNTHSATTSVVNAGITLLDIPTSPVQLFNPERGQLTWPDHASAVTAKIDAYVDDQQLTASEHDTLCRLENEFTGTWAELVAVSRALT